MASQSALARAGECSPCNLCLCRHILWVAALYSNSGNGRQRVADRPALFPQLMKSAASDLESTSQISRKRPRLLDEALSKDDRVALRFADSFASDNESLLLLQVPESLLGEIGEDADQGLVKLIGGQEQDAVLVTGTQTFKLTRAETSNTLLLVPPEGTCVSTEPISPVKRGVSCGIPGGGFDAVAAVGFQYEISKIAPSLEQIREILGACVYRGKDAEKSINPELLDMCSLEELQKRVQFSQRELRAGLHELDALPIQGRWRMVDPMLMEGTADKLLSAIVEHDMPLEKVNPKAVIEALPGCEALVLEHCLQTYSSCSRDDDVGASTREEYQLDLNKVARLRADQILRARERECARDGRPLLLSDFMEQWAASMPGVETPDHNLLKGIGLIDRKRGDDNNATVIYVPSSGLPFPPAERLSALFRIKPKWPMSELESYISEADRKAGFLLKNTRVSTDPATGQKLFSAR